MAMTILGEIILEKDHQVKLFFEEGTQGIRFATVTNLILREAMRSHLEGVSLRKNLIRICAIIISALEVYDRIK